MYTETFARISYVVLYEIVWVWPSHEKNLSRHPVFNLHNIRTLYQTTIRRFVSWIYSFLTKGCLWWYYKSFSYQKEWMLCQFKLTFECVNIGSHKGGPLTFNVLCPAVVYLWAHSISSGLIAGVSERKRFITKSRFQHS